MSKDKKTFLLAIVLWIILSVTISRIDERADVGVYTLNFLDMMLGLCTGILCLSISYWFIKPDEE